MDNLEQLFGLATDGGPIEDRWVSDWVDSADGGLPS